MILPDYVFITECLSSPSTVVPPAKNEGAAGGKTSALEGTSLILVIVPCIAGIFVIALITIFALYRSKWSKSFSTHSQDDKFTKKEAVYNSLYKSVEIKTDNSFQDVDLSGDVNLDSMYSKVNKPSKNPLEVIYS